jgi:DNA-binding response OmpR family regulator
MKVLLVEDEVDLAEAIADILRLEGYCVDIFASGQDAWDYWHYDRVEYDLAILDWMLPGLSGIDLCRQARQQGRDLPILILTARGEVADRVQGLDAGADDYLVKPFSQLELLARLRVFQRRIKGHASGEISVAAQGVILDPDRRSLIYTDPQSQSQAIALTNKEFQILEYLWKNNGKIVSTERIRNYIWDLNSDSFSNVVASHIRQIRKKLFGTPYAQIVETIPQTGYRLNLHDRS